MITPEAMVSLLFQMEQKYLAQKATDAHNARIEERDRETRALSVKQLNRQWKHSHRKGGRESWHGINTPDYNVHQHMFIDGRSKIWCGGCGWTAWSDGPAWQWEMALKLIEQSSNSASSSETLGRLPRGPLGEPEILTERQHRPYHHVQERWGRDERYLEVSGDDLAHIRGLDGLTKIMREYAAKTLAGKKNDTGNDPLPTASEGNK
jgi:hypothetical protein